MFYQPGTTPHNLPHDPFKVLLSPSFLQNEVHRMLTCNTGLRGPPPNRLDQHQIPRWPRQPRPYSQFTNLTFDPPYVMFSANQTRKDTVVNAETTGHFVWNLATYDLREAVNISAEQVPYGTDEFARA
ncbi:hypothetical protein SI65_09989 [Aspergillus cristatus]|uniref:Flavin reductase like domain-containing protein n=1 Tax=Aspergillus cristatus TaxID=573508 RepID=A0A1E3B142_ASPCR|nr:hypothetical protein SI65_09989 [Aspergillus cristatus]